MTETLTNEQTQKLSLQYPIESVLGPKLMPRAAAGEINGMNAVRLLRNSTGNAEAEMELGQLVTAAARENRWAGLAIPCTQEGYALIAAGAEAFKRAAKLGQNFWNAKSALVLAALAAGDGETVKTSLTGMGVGIAILAGEGFVNTAYNGGQLQFFPTGKLAELVKERVPSYLAMWR